MSTKRKAAKSGPPPPPPFPVVVETYRNPVGWSLDNLIQARPDAFNGYVNFRRYRITVEEIEEPIEVLRERLRKIWRECDNHHSWTPIRMVAASLGIELDIQDAGKDRKK